jgi:hypothetical protein
MKTLKRLNHWPNRSHPMLALASIPESGSLICPKCDSFMDQVILRGIPVERCESCLGIFFDDGEVDELLAKLAC